MSNCNIFMGCYYSEEWLSCTHHMQQCLYQLQWVKSFSLPSKAVLGTLTLCSPAEQGGGGGEVCLCEGWCPVCRDRLEEKLHSHELREEIWAICCMYSRKTGAKVLISSWLYQSHTNSHLGIGAIHALTDTPTPGFCGRNSPRSWLELKNGSVWKIGVFLQFVWALKPSSPSERVRDEAHETGSCSGLGTQQTWMIKDGFSALLCLRWIKAPFVQSGV